MWDSVKKNEMIYLGMCVLGGFVFLKYLFPLVAPGIAALLFVAAWGPFLCKLQKKWHIKRQIGMGILLLLFLILAAVFLWIVFCGLKGVLPEIPGYIEVFLQNVEESLGKMKWLQGLQKGSGAIQGGEKNPILQDLWNCLETVKTDFLPSAWKGMMNGSVRYLGKLGKAFFFLLIFIICVLMLSGEYDDLMGRMLEKKEWHTLLVVICEVVKYVGTWVKTQMLIFPVIAGVCGSFFGFMGVRNFVFYGILAGFLDMLPLIGTGFVIVPIGFSFLLQQKYVQCLFLALLYFICVLLRQLLEPKLIGKEMGMPAISVLLSIYAGLQLFGGMGIIKGPLGYLLIQSLWKARKLR